MTENAWPGRARRSPRLTDRSYLIHRPLSRALQRALDEARADGDLGTVVDVGCGVKPYRPWVVARGGRYVGVDIDGDADVLATGHDLPFESGYADVVLSTQVLEHVDEPDRAVAEFARILRPGGLALVSTHGVRPYHPTPHDYWRWTAEGLDRLFRRSGGFRTVQIVPCGGAVACVGSLVSLYIALAGERAARRIGRPLAGVAALGVASVNAISAAADRLVEAQPSVSKSNTMSANYLVAART